MSKKEIFNYNVALALNPSYLILSISSVQSTLRADISHIATKNECLSRLSRLVLGAARDGRSLLAGYDQAGFRAKCITMHGINHYHLIHSLSIKTMCVLSVKKHYY